MTEDKALDTEKPKEISEGSDISPTPPVKRTWGRVIHNEITYRGVDWLLNSAVGVAIGYLSARTKIGQDWFTKPVSGFFKRILSPVLKTEAAREEGAAWGARVISILAGGTAIIPSMIWLENRKNKKKIVRWFDEKIYGKEAVENDPKFEASYCTIDTEPHKGFITGMVSRFLALAPIIAAVSHPTTNKPLVRFVYNPFATVTQWAAKTVGIRPGAAWMDPMKGALEHIEGDPNIPKKMMSNWDFLHRLIGLDFGLTWIYSVLHEISYKALAALGMEKKEIQIEASAIGATLPSEQPCPPNGKPRAVTPREKSLEAPPASHTQKLAAQTEQVNQPSL